MTRAKPARHARNRIHKVARNTAAIIDGEDELEELMKGGGPSPEPEKTENEK